MKHKVERYTIRIISNATKTNKFILLKDRMQQVSVHHHLVAAGDDSSYDRIELDYHNLSLQQVRRIFKANSEDSHRINIRPYGAYWISPEELHIGCQIFKGAALVALRYWLKL